jgi:hypothetical protein
MLWRMRTLGEHRDTGEHAVFGRSHTTVSSTRDGLARIQAEYREMPGLRLTCEQVARLCGVELTACEHMLDALVSTKYLERGLDGRYALPVADTTRRATAPSFKLPRHRAG